jgi:hypothetical protein
LRVDDRDELRRALGEHGAEVVLLAGEVVVEQRLADPASRAIAAIDSSS